MPLPQVDVDGSSSVIDGGLQRTDLDFERHERRERFPDQPAVVPEHPGGLGQCVAIEFVRGLEISGRIERLRVVQR